MAKDLFSTQAASYAKYRPRYPQELFEYLASLADERQAAWDCATGNGQAALALAPYFDRVHATDISAEQLESATTHPKLRYALAPAEASGLPEHSIDLITVAQAYHWFDFAAFAVEARRVAKPGGLIAVWTYALATCEDPRIEELVGIFYRDVVGPYWDEERKYVEQHYETVPFPYEEIPARLFGIALAWTRGDLLGYLSTWSSVQHFKAARHSDPLAEFSDRILAAWPGEETKRFDFPLALRVGEITPRP